MPIASARATRCSVIANHFRERALDHQHLCAFVLEKLSHDNGLLRRAGNATRVYETVAALIETEGELLMQANADSVAEGRDVDGLILCDCPSAAEERQQQKWKTYSFHVVRMRSNEKEISHGRASWQTH
jgi:hypothetical protein